MQRKFLIRVSNNIRIFYFFIVLLFIGVIFVVGSWYDSLVMSERLILILIFVLMFAILGIVLWRAKNMYCLIKNGHLIIYGVLRTHTVQLSDIIEATRSPIPSGIRLMGASFLGGLYYFPSIGLTWVSMGDFNNGVLIRAKKKKNYIVTPDDPDEFLRLLRG